MKLIHIHSKKSLVIHFNDALPFTLATIYFLHLVVVPLLDKPVSMTTLANSKTVKCFSLGGFLFSGDGVRC